MNLKTENRISHIKAQAANDISVLIECHETEETLIGYNLVRQATVFRMRVVVDLSPSDQQEFQFLTPSTSAEDWLEGARLELHAAGLGRIAESLEM